MKSSKPEEVKVLEKRINYLQKKVAALQEKLAHCKRAEIVEQWFLEKGSFIRSD